MWVMDEWSVGEWIADESCHVWFVWAKTSYSGDKWISMEMSPMWDKGIFYCLLMSLINRIK